eukprot:188951_1
MATKAYVCILFQLCLYLITSTPSHQTDDECPRHRRPWYNLSDAERMQFVLGFQQLRNNGVLSAFCETHHLEGVAFENIHKTSEFLFWHSYFVWEVESEFRNLGGDYTCFSMPYWDITYDNTFLEDPDTDYLPIFDSLIGSDGNTDNNHCVEDELWNTDQYNVQFLCTNDETPVTNCCLKRERNNNVYKMGNRSELTNAMRYHKFRAFQDDISDIHGKIHKLFAQTNASHMYSNNAMEDPIFVLLHSFVDYIRLMRQDCWQYDQVSPDELDAYMPFVFDRYTVEMGDELDFKPGLDTKMQFASICDNERAFCHLNAVTPRVMFDAAPWGISYELGPFWDENEELQAFCDGNINNTWFYSADIERQVSLVVSDDGLSRFGDVLFKGLMYCIVGVIIAILVLFIVIREYTAIYKQEDRDMMTQLIGKEQEMEENRAMYGTI